MVVGNRTDRSRPETGWITTPPVRLFYRSWPGPASAILPPLLLLHGLASGSRIWDLIAPSLAEQRRVVALDQRGHGLSDKPDAGYDFASIVGDDWAALTALDLKHPMVVGHSWGASVALALAAWHSTRVSGVVLVDGGLSGFRDRPDWSWERVERELAPPDYAGTPRAEFLAWLQAGMPPGMWGAEVEEILLNIVELRADNTVGPRLARANHLRILRAMWDLDLTSVMAAVECPVTAVMAEGSGDDPRAAAWLERKRYGARLASQRLGRSAGLAIHWLPDTVHDVPLHRPAELTALIAGAAWQVPGGA